MSSVESNISVVKIDEYNLQALLTVSITTLLDDAVKIFLMIKTITDNSLLLNRGEPFRFRFDRKKSMSTAFSIKSG